ncbi:MAG: nucleotide sugar dehydrogenase [Thermodesulfovibrionales bacterium]|nr:nucleotide sugar dehydrogenase [Thermodesulfovibrionales bacterium]
MKIGLMGLGKLGLPVALAIEAKGHDVVGYDISEQVKNIVEAKKIPYKEIWAQEHLDKSKIRFVSVADVVSHSEIIFVPIQTPHDPAYEGITRIPEKRIDFDYTWLKAGVRTLSDEIEKQGKDKVVVIISTVLPGTIRREIKPLLGEHTKLCYNPFFIAMGTTMRDFLHPEFVLFGVDDETASSKAERFYRTIHHAPFYKTSIESAELIKVAYNTFISTKIAFVNTLMEMCHKLPGTNVDDVTNALKLGNRRIISNSYFSGGMGDGGGCHPRDNIALSWLARKLDISMDWFENIMMQRERQTDWLADLIEQHRQAEDAIYILGKSFKPETNIQVGSPSILLKNILVERGHDVIMYDPWVDETAPAFTKGVYFIGTKHPEFGEFVFPQGSVVLDPWRYIPDRAGVTVVRIGG